MVMEGRTIVQIQDQIPEARKADIPEPKTYEEIIEVKLLEDTIPTPEPDRIAYKIQEPDQIVYKTQEPQDPMGTRDQIERVVT